MKKIRNILYLIPLMFFIILIGCKTEELAVSAKITSISTTENSIEFYETTSCNLEISAKIVLEQNNTILKEIKDIVLNETTKYSFHDLEANTDYQIQVLYKYKSETYIKIASESVKTKELPTSDINIICEDASFVYDGKVKGLDASTSVEGLELVYTYSQNGNVVESPILPGEYNVLISFAGNQLYNPCSIERTLTITKAEISIACENQSFVYDGIVKSLSATIEGDLDLSYTYYLNEQKVDSPTDVGEYKVVISFAGNDLYNAASIERTLTITPSPVEISFDDFYVDYNQNYNITPDLTMDYVVKYYQGNSELTEKPTIPGTYRAVIQITDKNYSGTKEVNFTIKKLDYSVTYKNFLVLYGTPVSFDVENFVQVEYYLGNQKVDSIVELGEYDVIFSFKNHFIYNDFFYKIQVIVDNKLRISIEAQDIIVETGMDYTPSYTTNCNVELKIEYYQENEKIEKPSQAGIYTIKLFYVEDENYHYAEKKVNLYIYPEEQSIENLTNGLYHITGTVVGQNEIYSYVVNGNNVLFVKDTTLKLNETYDLVGIYDNTGTEICGSVIKKNRITARVPHALEVSLINFEKGLDSYLYKLISLKGMVVYRENQYCLALEDDYAIVLDDSFKNKYDTQTAISVNLIFYGTTYCVIGSEETNLTDIEKVYAEALFYQFADIVDSLPTETTHPFETQVSYISSSNPNIIDVNTLTIDPSTKEDTLVDLVVEFSIGMNVKRKAFTVKVLKAEITELNIYSIEMHQQYGDSTMITYGDFDILIDAGDKKDGPYVNQFLKEHISKDNHLDMMIVTHCHSDHMGGLAYIAADDRTTKALDGIASIGTIIDYGHDRSTNYLHKSWVNIRDRYIQGGSEYYPVYNVAKNLYGAKSHHQIDKKLSIDFIDTMTYATPEQNLSSTLNIYSVATLLTYENFKFFFAGDLEDKGESNLYNNFDNTPLKNITNDNVVLYKAAHHGTDPGGNNGGTNGGNQLPFLQKLKPDYFFASAAMCSGNYPDSESKKFIGGQPHPYIKCLANFLKFNDNVYFNGTNGTLEFITDGESMKSIHGYGATTNYLLEYGGSPINYASQADLKLIDTEWYKKNRKAAVDKFI